MNLMEACAPRPSPRQAEQLPAKVTFPALPERQQTLLQVLTQTPQSVDALAQQCSMTGEAGVELTFMEFDGLVRRLPGNTYIRSFCLRGCGSTACRREASRPDTMAAYDTP